MADEVQVTPFTFSNAITEGKKLPEEAYLPDGEVDYTQYTPFVINRGLSNFWGTCLIANELNKYPLVPKEAQFLFLQGTVSKKKRYSKWNKKVPVSPDVKLLMETYGYSEKKAQEAINILTENDIQVIRENVPDKGGADRITKTKRRKK
jgi:hypothetical protein